MGRSERTPMAWDRARQAARELGERCGPSAGRTEPLADALGATMATDLTALLGIPACDTAAMDGYAVAGDGPWRLAGRILAGEAPRTEPLVLGSAVEIATGAPVPPGADAVLPYERSRLLPESAAESAADGGSVGGVVEPGRHIRRAGEDTGPGDIVLKQGCPVTPAVLGLAAGLGHDELDVRRPRVAVLITGDEVVPAGVPAPGAVRDAIGPMLPGLVSWAGARADAPVRVRDRLDGTAAALRDAAYAGADVIAVCGSSSKGPADHLRSALRSLGATAVVDGVACRPGHPQLLAHLGPPHAPGTAVVGLPGNPNAALVAALTLLTPLLAELGGRPDPAAAAPERVRIDGEIVPHARDTRLVAVRSTGAAVRPIGNDRPGSLRSPAAGDAYAVIPPGWRGPEAGVLLMPR